MCVKGDTISGFGTPEDIFGRDVIRDLYEIDNGFFDPCFGSIELARPVGEPEIFVISSCGSGIPVYRRLQKENLPFAAGILYTNDIDCQVASLLASEVVTEEPFQEISQTAYQRALECIKKCSRVICPGIKIGSCNYRMADLLREAKEMGKLEL